MTTQNLGCSLATSALFARAAGAVGERFEVFGRHHEAFAIGNRLFDECRAFRTRTKIRVMAATASATLVLTPCAAQVNFNVSSTCNIYGAGHALPPAPAGQGAGILPFAILIGPNVTFVEFSNVQGQIDFGCAGGCSNGPAGVVLGACPVLGWNGISGFQGTRGRDLRAVFVGVVEPANPVPPSLVVTDYSFGSMSPLLRQQFPVGNGLSNAGVRQRFYVPPGATRMFLGFADAIECGGLPGGYFNNTGNVTGVADLIECGTIVGQPLPVLSCVSASSTFQLTAAGTGPLTYQWRKNGNPIDPIANPSAATNTLTLTYVGPDDVASYDCIVTNACGSVTSNSATLTVCKCLTCAADFNEDGGVDGEDVSAFFAAWESGICDADVNQDGGVDGDDVGVFFADWEAGGC